VAATSLEGGGGQLPAGGRCITLSASAGEGRVVAVGIASGAGPTSLPTARRSRNMPIPSTHFVDEIRAGNVTGRPQKEGADADATSAALAGETEGRDKASATGAGDG
jgi:hypothetical protein